MTRHKPAKIDHIPQEKLYQKACCWLQDPANRKASGKPDFPGLLRLPEFRSLKYGTLRNRYLNLHRDAHNAHQEQMLLSSFQETVLAEWMAKDARESRPWSRAQVSLRVKKMTGMAPGKNWIQAFKRRHADVLDFTHTSGLDPKRARCFNPTTVKEHNELFGVVEGFYRIKANWDETGQQRGGGRKRSGKKYFCCAGDKNRKKLRDGNLELSTIHECCLSDGSMLDPGFIFQGTSNFTMEWFEGFEDRHISVGLTPNGWTDDEQSALWFEHVAVPQLRAKCEDKEEHVLLIFDGHHSHLSDKIYALALEHKIDFYLLPSHTTHRLQPLDVGCFGPMQKRFIDRCEQIVEETGAPISRDIFIREYMKIREETITPDVVRKAWRKTGLHPWNPNIFTEQDFAPSRAWSTKAHFPCTFPNRELLENVDVSILSRDIATTQAGEHDSGEGHELHDIPIVDSLAPNMEDMDMDVDRDDGTSSESHAFVEAPLEPTEVEVGEDAADLLRFEPMAVNGSASSETNHVAGSEVGDPSLAEVPPNPSNNSPEVWDTYLPLPGARSFPFQRQAIPRQATQSQRVQILTDDLEALLLLCRAEFEGRQRAETHCAMAALEIRRLKQQLQEKGKKEKQQSKRFSSKARFLMAPQAKAAHEARLKEQEAKKREEQEKQARQHEKDREDQERRVRIAMDPTYEFTGALSEHRAKPDLQDIAHALGLPFTQQTKRKELVSAITTRLLESPAFQQETRFKKLYAYLERNGLSAATPSSESAASSHEDVTVLVPDTLRGESASGSMHVEQHEYEQENWQPQAFPVVVRNREPFTHVPMTRVVLSDGLNTNYLTQPSPNQLFPMIPWYPATALPLEYHPPADLTP